MKRLVLLVSLLGFSTPNLANPLSVTGARVSRVQAYETGANPHVWIHLNGNPRVGPNPVNPGVTCELWTDDKTVYSTALAAMLAGRSIDVTYVDRGDGSYWCKVQSLAIVE
jgi:hypothetical protein